MKAAVMVIACVLLALASIFGLQYFGYASFSFFAPKYAQVQTDTFHNSQAYTDGMANDLGDLRLQYLGATTQEQKDAIAAVVRQRFAAYDKSKLPSELRDWYFSLQ